MKGRQICELLRGRRAIARRPPGHDIGDVNRCAIEADRRQHPVEQFAGPADERQTLDVFVASRRFADKHQPRVRIAICEDQLGRSRFEGTTLEPVEHGAQFVECCRALYGVARSHGRFIGSGRCNG